MYTIAFTKYFREEGGIDVVFFSSEDETFDFIVNLLEFDSEEMEGSKNLSILADILEENFSPDGAFSVTALSVYKDSKSIMKLA